MSAIGAEALKEKNALEKAQPEVPDGMADTSKPLSLEFFINPRCPSGVVPTEVPSVDVRPGEATNVPEREPPTAVLQTDNSKVGEYLSAAEVGPGNEPVFSV